MQKFLAATSPEITPEEQAHMDYVRSKAGECMVLLENNGVLPLKKVGNVALYGNGARQTVKGGTGSGDVNSRFVVNVEQGLEAAGFTVTTKSWLDAQTTAAADEHNAFLAHVQQRAKDEGKSLGAVMMDEHFLPVALAPITAEQIHASNTDTAIYVLARNSGEGADRSNIPGDYQLLPQEVENLKTLGENYKNVIVLLNVGGVLNVQTIREIPGVSAILFICQSGNVGGYVVADVLLGKSIPSGRLADTWAMAYEDYPSSAEFSHNNGNWDDEYYKDGIFVGYRYFDTFGVAPLYPFGYGKNYTDFAMETLGVTADEENVTVEVKVTNSGTEYHGKEVVQIYGSAPAGTLEKPMQVLCGFGKTDDLAPGQSQTLKISFPLRNLESYDPRNAAYVLEAGTYYIRVGNSSRNTHIAAALCLDATAVTKQVKNIFAIDRDFEEITSKGAVPYTYEGEAEEKQNAPVIALSAAKVPCEKTVYSTEPAPFAKPDTDAVITLADVKAGKYTLEDLVSQLTVEEMADFCVGTSRTGVGSAVGAAARRVVGAAGDTSMQLAPRGIGTMTNADGPAGLRLTSHFRVNEKGEMTFSAQNFDKVVDGVPEKQPDETDYYQYCTAIPIATLMASSWDMDLIRSMGDIVGAELERFGVQIWLAPGMNIHRNPLCGRNFEYFSEDPLLSGLCAASDVLGAQSHKGIGTSIKHFLANNQEDNRMFINAHIHERALREIYLRNFGVAMQAAQPMTIMTSYNLINGIHAANSYDAITDYARDEMGFAGYVMTDWCTSIEALAPMFAKPNPKYPCSSSVGCILAGNDLQMPGCEPNVTDIIAGVQDGRIPLGVLQTCVLRMLKVDIRCSSSADAYLWSENHETKAFVTVEK